MRGAPVFVARPSAGVHPSARDTLSGAAGSVPARGSFSGSTGAAIMLVDVLTPCCHSKMKNAVLIPLAVVLSGCADGSSIASTPASGTTAIYSPPVRLGGRGSVMFIPASSHRTSAKPDQSARQEGDLEADNLEAIADSADFADRNNPPEASANADEIELACRLALRFSDDFRRIREGRSVGSVDNLDARLKSLRWKSLPKSGRCDAKHSMNFHSKGFGEYVEAVAESADRKLAAIRGGWQLDPLAGAGGECLYEQLPAGRLKLLGCVRTSVS